MGLRFCFEEEWKLSEVDMDEVDGLRQIGGLRKEISDAMMGMVDAMPLV